LNEPETSAFERWARSLLLLAEGQYAEGWPLYEARLEIPELNAPGLSFPMPVWRGEDLTGKRLLLVGEQGFGDQIMFFRFIRNLQAKGAACDALISPKVAPLFPGATPGSSGVAIPQADYWITVGSVPHRLGVTLETIPTRRYIQIESPRVGGIGVVTRVSPTHANDAHRSLPPAYAERLLRLGRSLEPEVTGFKTFRQTAELIAGLDLVITIDSAVAHLAGAMHKPVWVLLPAANTDWRWLKDRRDSPWYPTMRLFRQPHHGDWESVLREVEGALGVRLKPPECRSL
jgi:hypothetical protein